MKRTIKIFGLPIYSETRSTATPVDTLRDISDFGNFMNQNDAGIAVTQNTALTFSAVWACVRIISNTVAMLPFSVYRAETDGDRMPASTHRAHKLIHDEPNQIQSAFTWRQVMQAHATLKGNGYSIIHRDGSFRPGELELIENPDDVQPFIYQNKLYYKVNGKDKPYQAYEIFHIRGLGFNGISGKSVLSVARQSIGGALAMQSYGNTIFKNGGAKRVALTHSKVFNDEKARKNIIDSWNKKYAGPENANSVALVDGGFDVKEIGMNPEDAQFIGSREFSINEIARYFGLITDLLATDKQATYASAEQRAIDFVKYTMTPWLVTWESEVNRKLFPDFEKGKFYSKFTLEGLLRGDAQSRTQYYKDMFYLGALSRDEIRQLEERNKVAGGEKYYLQLNMAEADRLMENVNNTKKNETTS